MLPFLFNTILDVWEPGHYANETLWFIWKALMVGFFCMSIGCFFFLPIIVEGDSRMTTSFVFIEAPLPQHRLYATAIFRMSDSDYLRGMHHAFYLGFIFKNGTPHIDYFQICPLRLSKGIEVAETAGIAAIMYTPIPIISDFEKLPCEKNAMRAWCKEPGNATRLPEHASSFITSIPANSVLYGVALTCDVNDMIVMYVSDDRSKLEKYCKYKLRTVSKARLLHRVSDPSHLPTFHI